MLSVHQHFDKHLQKQNIINETNITIISAETNILINNKLIKITYYEAMIDQW